VLNPSELYTLTEDLPAVDRPVLVHALTGFVDAGNASRLAREHLLTVGSPRTLATFDLDQLYDYRSRGCCCGSCATRPAPSSCCWTGRSRTCSGSGSPRRSSS
jgi:hypothetical protein